MNSTGPVDDKDIDPSHGNVANSSGTFSFGVRLGLVFVVQIASISAVLVSGLLSYILWQAIKSYRRRRTWHWPSHIHIYFISLLCSDFIQAVGAIMDTAWIHDAGVVEGPFCTAQGMIEQIGDVGVALAILAIAVSTWGHIVLHWTTAPSPKVALVIVSLIWSFVILVTSISLGVHRNRVDPYYGNTKYWCWIRSPTYWKDGIALEYAWMWMTALVNILLYIPVTITLLKSRRQKKALALDSVVYREKDPHERSIQTMAFQMSLYPVIYIITITPISIARFIQFARPNNPPPFAFTTFASILFSSSGMFNVLLFSITRPALIPGRPFGIGRSAIGDNKRRQITTVESEIVWRRGTGTALRNANGTMGSGLDMNMTMTMGSDFDGEGEQDRDYGLENIPEVVVETHSTHSRSRSSPTTSMTDVDGIEMHVGRREKGSVRDMDGDGESMTTGNMSSTIGTHHSRSHLVRVEHDRADHESIREREKYGKAGMDEGYDLKDERDGDGDEVMVFRSRSSLDYSNSGGARAV